MRLVLSRDLNDLIAGEMYLSDIEKGYLVKMTDYGDDIGDGFSTRGNIYE